jgi:arabinan endo-1,5-alpha-L-arabinosidase
MLSRSAARGAASFSCSRTCVARMLSRSWLLAALSLACAEDDASDLKSAPPSDADASRGTRVPAVSPAPDYYVPTLHAEFQRVYAPSGHRYLNDHTIVRDDNDLFHVFGITDDSEGKPFEERSFLHATAISPEGPWSELPDALFADRSLDGCCIWAPFITRAATGWHIYYAGVRGARVLRRAESPDLVSWVRSPAWATDEGRAPGGRDPFVLLAGGRRYLYSVGVDSASRGQIVMTTQDEDEASAWSALLSVITDPVPSFGWGNLESPFVVPYEGRNYLFLTRTGEGKAGYFVTLVFASDRLDRWEWSPIAEIPAHAAEVVNADGKWFVSSGGSTALTGEDARGLSIAPFSWELASDSP